VNQMIGYDVKRKAAERTMNAWTLELCEAVRGLQGVAADQYVVLCKMVW